MGVGPGALDEYWDIIYTDERFLGGCIWEWADHAHFDPKGKYRYTYGGDHGDRLNNGNFCCDGLFFPDRTPSPSALCMKMCTAPFVRTKGKIVFIYTITITSFQAAKSRSNGTLSETVKRVGRKA